MIGPLIGVSKDALRMIEQPMAGRPDLNPAAWLERWTTHGFDPPVIGRGARYWFLPVRGCFVDEDAAVE
jgi:hypothetical protein